MMKVILFHQANQSLPERERGTAALFLHTVWRVDIEILNAESSVGYSRYRSNYILGNNPITFVGQLVVWHKQIGQCGGNLFACNCWQAVSPPLLYLHIFVSHHDIILI